MTHIPIRHFYLWPLLPELDDMDGDATDEIFASLNPVQGYCYDLGFYLIKRQP